MLSKCVLAPLFLVIQGTNLVHQEFTFTFGFSSTLCCIHIFMHVYLFRYISFPRIHSRKEPQDFNFLRVWTELSCVQSYTCQVLCHVLQKLKWILQFFCHWADFCHFAKVSYFWLRFFHVFMGKTSTKLEFRYIALQGPPKAGNSILWSGISFEVWGTQTLFRVPERTPSVYRGSLPYGTFGSGENSHKPKIALGKICS